MADGLARVTGTPGVCLVTSGPGATNLLTGVAAAHVAHSPVVVLVGGIASEHSDKDAFQEFDLVSMFRPVTKMAVKVTRADRIPEMLHAALRLAMTGRRGPVFLEIPRDVLNDRLPGRGDVRAGPLSGDACIARQPRGHPGGRAPGAACGAASAAGRRRRKLGRRGRCGGAPL